VSRGKCFQPEDRIILWPTFESNFYLSFRKRTLFCYAGYLSSAVTMIFRLGLERVVDSTNLSFSNSAILAIICQSCTPTDLMILTSNAVEAIHKIRY